MAYANLHIHTAFSDGTLSPSAVMKAIVDEPDLTYYAITDHDTMSGIEPVFRFREKYVHAKRSLFIPGIEVSLTDQQTELNVHLIGLFPYINHDNHREELKKIDRTLGDFCRFRCLNRGMRDLDARVRWAFDLNLDGLFETYNSADEIISILRAKAEEKNRAIFEEAGKDGDVIQHPIPVTYQTILDHWEELMPHSTRERIGLYVFRPDRQKRERLQQIYVSDGLGESDAKALAETNQGILCNIKKPALEEKGVLEGLGLLQKARAVTILAHPAVDHLKVGYDDFDHYVLNPLIAHGMDGIEVFYPYDTSYREEATEHYAEIARTQGLLVSGGTDFHGDGRIGLGDVKLSCEEASRIVRSQPLPRHGGC